MFYYSVYPLVGAFADTNTSKMYSANKNSIFTFKSIFHAYIVRNLSEFRVLFNDVLPENIKDIPEIASNNSILSNASERYILIKQNSGTKINNNNKKFY